MVTSVIGIVESYILLVRCDGQGYHFGDHGGEIPLRSPAQQFASCEEVL